MDFTITSGYIHRASDPDMEGVAIEMSDCQTLWDANREYVRSLNNDYRTQEEEDRAVQHEFDMLTEEAALTLLEMHEADLEREFWIRERRKVA